MRKRVLCIAVLMFGCLVNSAFAMSLTFDEARSGLFSGWVSEKDGAVLGTSADDWSLDLQHLPFDDIFGNRMADIYFSQKDGVVYGAVDLGSLYSDAGANLIGLYLKERGNDGDIFFSLTFDPINDPDKGNWLSNAAPNTLSTDIPLNLDGFGQTVFPEGAVGESMTAEAFIYYNLEYDYFLFASRRYDGNDIDVTDIPELIGEYWVATALPVVTPTPEPATILLMGAASGIGLCVRRFRKKPRV